MQVKKALLVKFIENKCSREEAELVHKYLIKHPQAIDELLNDEEWELDNSNGVLDKQRSDAWYENIQKQKGSGRIIKLEKVGRDSSGGRSINYRQPVYITGFTTRKGEGLTGGSYR